MSTATRESNRHFHDEAWLALEDLYEVLSEGALDGEAHDKGAKATRIIAARLGYLEGQLGAHCRTMDTVHDLVAFLKIKKPKKRSRR